MKKGKKVWDCGSCGLGQMATQVWVTCMVPSVLTYSFHMVTTFTVSCHTGMLPVTTWTNRHPCKKIPGGWATFVLCWELVWGPCPAWAEVGQEQNVNQWCPSVWVSPDQEGCQGEAAKDSGFLESLRTNPFRLGGTEAEGNVIDLLWSVAHFSFWRDHLDLCGSHAAHLTALGVGGNS